MHFGTVLFSVHFGEILEVREKQAIEFLSISTTTKYHSFNFYEYPMCMRIW